MLIILKKNGCIETVICIVSHPPRHVMYVIRRMAVKPLNLLVLCFALSCGSNNKKCTSVDECRCTELRDQTSVANCSDLMLKSFPNFNENVSVIYLNNNKIQIGKICPRLPKNLRRLYISGNRIWYNGSSGLCFIKNLTKLEILDISNNVDFKRKATFPSADFQFLEKLTTLFIDGLWGGNFNGNGWKSTRMTNLTIGGRKGKCYFDRLHKDFFSGIRNLKFLTIRGCRSLRSIDKGVFRCLRLLHTLDISFNENLKFAPLQNVSYDLQFTKVQIFRARRLHCFNGIGTYLSKRDFAYFQNTSIKQFDLSRNRIELMDMDVPLYFPMKLEILNVSYNQFIWGTYLLSYHFLRNLRVLDARGQYFFKRGITDVLSCSNYLDCEEPSSNPVNINISEETDNFTFLVPHKLEKFYFHSSKFSFSIQEINFKENHIKEYNLQNNIFHSLDGPIYGMEHAKFVDFSGNFVKYISPFFFKTVSNITHLNLSGNLLGNCLNQVEENDHFHALIRLIEIRLSNNEISTLPPKLLSNAKSLQILDLSHNIITNYIVTLHDSCALRYLDLSSNRLQSISQETIQRLEKIQKLNNLSVDLSGNQLDCTCATIFFLKWIQNSEINFVKKNAYQCRFVNSRKRTFIDLSSILDELKHDCFSHLPTTISMTVSIATVFVLAITFMLYRFRWPIRYFYYLAKWDIIKIMNPTKQNLQKNYKYSAFIAYAEKESIFVESELVYHLENITGRKLCLPNRDFSPNLRTYANVATAIHNSKKIICIITEDFLKDYWCMYQLQMAEEDRIEREDSDYIVFILFKSLTSEQLGGIHRSLFLFSLIEKRSYALFPEHEDDRPIFWRKLIDTVQ